MALHLPLITITFPNPINVSVQRGDIAYYLNNVTNLGSFSKPHLTASTTHGHSNYNDIIQIGEIVSIDQIANSITCFWDPNPPFSPYPPAGAFIMFSKDNKANLSSMLGYYAEIQFVNNSSTEAELFSVGVDTFISSK